MEELVRQAQKGDGDAFTELMQSQMQNLYKTARAMLKNDEDAADAISDTILACWEKIGQVREIRFFRTWMTKILINKCNDILRQYKKDGTAEEISDNVYFSERYENIEWLETLKSLDEKYRLVMVLYYVDGLDTAEISEFLKIPGATVRTRLARGRNRISDIYRTEPERRAK